MQLPPTSPGSLTTAQLQLLADARTRSRRVWRAASVASFSGWSMAVFAALTLLGALFGGLSALVVGLGLAVLAANELRGGSLLRRLDFRGPRVLGWNQVALGLFIVGYSAWSLVSALHTPALASLGGSTGDAKVDAMITELSTVISLSLYTSMGVIGVIVPGLTAWYYFSRAASLRALHAAAPPWAVEALRIAA